MHVAPAVIHKKGNETSDHFLRASLASLAAGVVLQSVDVHAESFEVISYTPPRGWAVQNVQDRRTYVRPDGIGAVTFHASRPDASSAPRAFAAMWRTHIEPVLPGPASAPQIQREGDFEVAVGAREARAQDMQDMTVTVSLVTVVGGGRTLGVVGIAGGDEAVRELIAFFDTVTLTPAAATPEQGPASRTARASGGLIAIEPPGFDDNRPVGLF